jgi:hypothetical protein
MVYPDPVAPTRISKLAPVRGEGTEAFRSIELTVSNQRGIRIDSIESML